MSLLGYARISETGWHTDCRRSFVCTLPGWVPPWSKLHDETGVAIGEVTRLWASLPNGKTTCRIRLSAEVMHARPSLREDLLAHRLNISVTLTPQGRCLSLADRIDIERLPAAPRVVHDLFPWLEHVA